MSQSDLSDEIHEKVAETLAHYTHTTLKKSLQDLNAIGRIEGSDGVLTINLILPFLWNSGFEQIKQQLTSQLISETGFSKIVWQINYAIKPLLIPNQQPAVPGIKNIIAVSSGKGGVGKSSTAVNLALALQKCGAKVGLLDADIYGPSIPTMLGTVSLRPTSTDGEHMFPVFAHGLATNSVGYLLDDNDAVIWRGPMASKALLQILNDTQWPDLDYLVIDMPPGTGDIQLTLAKNIPVTGAVVVTTPQDIALLDATKGLSMFKQVDVPVLGIIENMSVYICPECGHEAHLFGQGGANKMAKNHQVDVLGYLPLAIELREDLDRGQPTVIHRPDSPITHAYTDLAQAISEKLYWTGKTAPTTIPFKAV